MSIRCLLAAVLAIMAAAPALARDAVCDSYDGADVVTAAGTFIGRVTDRYTPDSIFNRLGPYGSRFGADSIWNAFGANGGDFAMTSALNPHAPTPPKLVRNGEVVGYLSTNKTLPGTIDPVVLGIVCYDVAPL